MSYALFDLLALVVPLTLLAALGRQRLGRSWWVTSGLLLSGALLWTAPWDDYLVRSGIWSYDPDQVVGRFGAVPVEEYAFVALEVALVAVWARVCGSLPDVPDRAGSDSAARWSGAWGWTAVALTGGLLTLAGGHTEYVGLLLLWAAPPIALQHGVGGDVLRTRRRARLRALLPVALWLSLADSVAIAAGTWSIAPRTSTGWTAGGLPVEEVLFFVLTCLLVVDGLVLGTDPAVLRRLHLSPVGSALTSLSAPVPTA